MNHQATITIGGLPIKIGCTNGNFIEMLEQRYGKFIKDSPAGSLCPKVGEGIRPSNWILS